MEHGEGPSNTASTDTFSPAQYDRAPVDIPWYSIALGMFLFLVGIGAFIGAITDLAQYYDYYEENSAPSEDLAKEMEEVNTVASYFGMEPVSIESNNNKMNNNKKGPRG